MPELFKRAWARWKFIAEKIGSFNARVILTLLYFIVIIPFGLIQRIARSGFRPPAPGTNWHTRPEPPSRKPDYSKQF